MPDPVEAAPAEPCALLPGAIARGEDRVNARPAWLRWLSLPSALLGVVAFFMPWVYISCGSIKGNITGYEFATGAWEEKIGAARARRLKERLQVDRARRLISADRPGDTGQTILNPEQPLLWIIPGAMAAAAAFIVLRAPRLVSLVAIAIAAGGLGYFKYRFALEVANARVPAQVTLQWLSAYWVSWVAVLLLLLLCLLSSPRERTILTQPTSTS